MPDYAYILQEWVLGRPMISVTRRSHGIHRFASAECVRQHDTQDVAKLCTLSIHRKN